MQLLYNSTCFSVKYQNHFNMRFQRNRIREPIGPAKLLITKLFCWREIQYPLHVNGALSETGRTQGRVQQGRAGDVMEWG